MNYLNTFSNLQEAKSQLIADMTADFSGTSISSPANGNGTIIEILDVSTAVFSKTFSIITKIKFDSGKESKFDLITSISKGFISFSDSTKLDLYNEYIVEVEQISEYEQEKELASYEAARQAKEKAEEELKAEKEAIKFEQKKKAQLTNADKLITGSTHRSGSEYYYSLGWLFKHAKSFSATMPDYFENWFTRNFGTAKHTTVNSHRLTSGGHLMQWSLSLKIELDTNDNIPTYLESHLGEVSKEIRPISDTQFIFDIMANEGFVFGKAKDQDLNKILSNIPSEYVDDFNRGQNG